VVRGVAHGGALLGEKGSEKCVKARHFLHFRAHFYKYWAFGANFGAFWRGKCGDLRARAPGLLRFCEGQIVFWGGDSLKVSGPWGVFRNHK